MLDTIPTLPNHDKVTLHLQYSIANDSTASDSLFVGLWGGKESQFGRITAMATEEAQVQWYDGAVNKDKDSGTWDILNTHSRVTK